MTITTDTDRGRAERLDAALRGAAGDRPLDLRGPAKAGAAVNSGVTTPVGGSVAVPYDDDELFDNVPI